MSIGAHLNRREFMLSAGAPLFAAQPAEDPLKTAILGEVRLGAQFFLNRSESKESIALHFRRMAGNGLTLVRIFTIWDHVEPEKDQWDFSGYDAIYEAAGRNGILIANTLCSEDPPGWMGTAPFYHQWQDLSNPQLRPSSEQYIQQVVTRYRNHPAHGAWLLQNEPGIRGQPGRFVLPLFASWLQRKYGTVEALNKRWYRRLKRFEDAPFPVEPREAGWPDYPSLLDWRNFWCDHLADQQRWIRAQVEKHHPNSLTHSNPPGLLSNMLAVGRDLWKIKPTVHFMGASMHASWQFGAFARDEFGIAYGFCCDLLRSVSAPAPYWVTEMQAGPTVLTGSRPLNPTAGEITRWLWDGIGNGSRGIIFWLWHPRTEGNEAGEWGLAGPSGESTPRTEAAKAVASVLAGNRDFFSNARPAPATAAILYNRETMLLHLIESWRKPGSLEPIQSLLGCYKALHRAHVPVDFVSTEEVESGAISRYRVLYLPFCYALTEKAVEGIRRFTAAGGTVWADGLVGWKNEKGETFQMAPGPLSDVFGFTLQDVEARWEPFSFANTEESGELWHCLIPKSGARVLASTPDGQPAAVENRFGQGRAIYHGTALTLAVLRRALPEAERWISSPAMEAVRTRVRFESGPEAVSFRVLSSAGRDCAVLNNWGAAAQVSLRFQPGTRSATDLITGRRLQLGAAGEVVAPIPAGGTSLLLSER